MGSCEAAMVIPRWSSPLSHDLRDDIDCRWRRDKIYIYKWIHRLIHRYCRMWISLFSCWYPTGGSPLSCNSGIWYARGCFYGGYCISIFATSYQNIKMTSDDILASHHGEPYTQIWPKIGCICAGPNGVYSRRMVWASTLRRNKWTTSSSDAFLNTDRWISLLYARTKYCYI